MPGFRTALKVVLAAAACLGGLAGSFASAQGLVQPPALSTIDANGVNLADDQFQLPGASVGIGTAASGLQRVASEGGADNWANFANVARKDASQVLSVSFMGTTYLFLVGSNYNGTPTYVNGPYTAVNAAGVTIVCAGPNVAGPCTLYLADGTQAFYTNAIQASTGNSGVLQSATLPSGEVISETYYLDGSGLARSVKAVTSSKGWELWYAVDGSYDVTQVTALNTSQTWCDPNGTSCSPGSAYPYATDTISGTTHTIAQNGVTLATYTVNGSTTTLTSPAGVTTTVTNNSSGQVASVTRGGSTWYYTYESEGNDYGTYETIVYDPVSPSKSHSLTVNSFGQALSRTDDAGRTTTYSYYSSTGNGAYLNALYEVISPDATYSGSTLTGGYTVYTYNSNGMPLTETTYPKGGGTPIVVSQSYGNACNGSFTNNAVCDKPTSTTDANGVVTTYTYDNNGDVLTATLPAQSNGVQPETVYNYTPVTPYIYTSSSGTTAQAPVMVLTQTASCMTSAWNGSGCNGGATDERLNTISYNTSNLLPISTTASVGDGSLPQTVTTTYNNNGWVLTTQGVQQTVADETYTFYDALGRQVGTVGLDPDGTGPRHRQGTHTSYDADGHVQEVDTGIVGDGVTTAYSGGDPVTRNAQAYNDWTAMTPTSTQVQERNFNEFDGYGRPWIEAVYVGNAATPKDVTQQSYDSMQRLQCTAVRLNSSDYANDFSTLKAAGACALGTTGADGSQDRITQYSYDVLSNVTSAISGYGTSLERIDFTKEYDVASSTSTNSLTWASDAKGNKTSYEYDNFDRLAATCYPTAGNGATTNMSDCDQTAYVASLTVNGVTQASTRIDHMTLRDGQTVTVGYDSLGRVTGTSGAIAESIGYDNFNNVTSHSKNGQSEAYGFNALGWLTQESNTSIGGSDFGYGYDAYGRRTKLTYPDGFYVTYGYDAGDEPTGVFENGATQLIGFDYDDYGHRAHLYRANGVTTTYGFDSNLRLGSITQGSSGASFYNQATYGYNAADQITSKSASNSAYNFVPSAQTTSYSVDGLNRISSVNGSSFAYDGRGNLTGDNSGSAYVYNAENLLTSATQSGVTSTLTYDAEDRLYSVTKNGVSTRFIYEGTKLLGEYDGSGNLLRRYIQGPGNDEPLVMYDYTQGGAQFYLGADDNGSVNLITNASGGQYAINTYDEYGLQGSANTGRFQYTGQTWLTEVGMYYYKARLYNPAIGRFMQADPLGYADGMNRYDYVHGDPVNRTDSSGLYVGWGPVYSIGMCTVQPFNTPMPNASSTDPANPEKTVSISGGLYQSWIVDCTGASMPPNVPTSGFYNPFNVNGSEIIKPAPIPSCAHQGNLLDWLPHGGGVALGGEAAAGLLAFSGGTKGNVAAGGFLDETSGLSGAIQTSGAVAANLGTMTAGAPKQTSITTVLGAYIGGGVSGYFTNARSYQQLEGPFETVAVNVGLIVNIASVEVSYGNGIYQVSISPPDWGVGAVADLSMMTTNTTTQASLGRGCS